MLGEIKLSSYELTNLLTTRINQLSQMEQQVAQHDQNPYGIDTCFDPGYYGIQSDQGVIDVIDEVEILWHALKEKYEGVAEIYDSLLAKSKGEKTGESGCCQHNQPVQNLERGSESLPSGAC